MDDEALKAYLFDLNAIEREALVDPRVPRLFANEDTIVLSMLEEDIFKPDQKIAFMKHPRYMITTAHKHDFLEMNYVFAGRCVQTINGKQVILNEGEFCLLDTYVTHTIEPAGENDIIMNCLMRKNYFDADLLKRLSGNDLISEFITDAVYKNKASNQYIVFPSGGNPKIQRLMQEVLIEYFAPGLCSEEIINSYMIILFSELLRIFKQSAETDRASGLQKVLITDVLLYIEQNYAEVTLTSAAKHFGFHPNYLSRMIKNHLGASFIKIVQDVKLSRACSILENTGLSVVKVAQEVGFSNMNVFYELFQQRFGMTPKAYRSGKRRDEGGSGS
ncbi:AraC-like DNA-binding protein/mannose-6-phosphate isomerase-like protein (cupin superfamily) [Paenibacillus phyllosphaerae]|uniref:AraC-like DNA-binding protein/mannose-6-phosphate isomerase-like protein (Cupin superfamily) n=1 Tax=Paenibacillus phyllosphaerae TaxID=274593 RepID=A0A7W5B1D9_9BACL|nr:AraC family transcriptional regulator [Paenibacillus phyllosphaerae]MBB3112472.1 AraC-like DNA-binding protein/mannose-6-phosphate isomerase-like protein (cupin superfamily) [Paenibacillus phyllosphaerae]